MFDSIATFHHRVSIDK